MGFGRRIQPDEKAAGRLLLRIVHADVHACGKSSKIGVRIYIFRQNDGRNIPTLAYKIAGICLLP
jgi:hypothetical protein